ncbi:MAG: hypothetical protein AB7G93_03275 [Bdellovibrionales bacterium]
MGFRKPSADKSKILLLFLASILAFIFSLVLAAPVALAAEKPAYQVKSDALNHLQELRNENVRQLRTIDAALSKKMDVETRDASGKSIPLDKEVQSLQAAKREHLLRLEVVNRLIHQISKNFGGGDLRAFLEGALTDMAKVEVSKVDASADSGLWKFLRYARDAIRALPEQKENILSYLEGYMNRSVSNPIRPEEYISSRNYTNGAESEAASPLSREEVGAIADRRLNEMNQGREAAPVVNSSRTR